MPEHILYTAAFLATVALLLALMEALAMDMIRLLIAALMWLAVGAVTVALAWLVVLLGAAAGM